MTLPTMLVIIFLYGGNVYQEIQVAPSMEACMAVQKDVKTILVKAIGQVPDAYHASCITLKPFTRDT
jgi:hypothetical protein